MRVLWRAWVRMSTSSPNPWWTSTFTMLMASFWSSRNLGSLRLCTEFGTIDIEPCEIAVIPRGVKIRVELGAGTTAARGYICENYGGAFTLPERGPIGANCMANQRDFLTPVARHGDKDGPCTMTVKWGGAMWRTELKHSPPTSSPGTAITPHTNTTSGTISRSALSFTTMPIHLSSR